MWQENNDMEKVDCQQQANECIKREYPVSGQVWTQEGRELFALGYGKAMKEVKARLLASRRKMVEAYRKSLGTVPDKEAYHGATAVMALEVEMLIEELGKIST